MEELEVIGPILRQLNLLMRTEESLPEDSKDMLQRFIKDLEQARYSVKEEEDSSFTDKCWMNEVREICYDAEDYLPPSAGVGDITLIAEDISELAARLEAATTRREGWQLPEFMRDRLQQDARERRERCQYALAGFETVKSMLQDPDAGLDDPMEKLVDLLAFDDSEQQLKVVPIFGLAGVGKTTLARRLYHHYGGGRFHYRAFIRVSRKPDTRRLLTSMLSQIDPQHQGFGDVQALTDDIKKLLRDKTYLIIVDDIWATSVWDIIGRAFPKGDRYSRIIITTQIEDVALACCSYNPKNIFEMRPHSDAQTQKLFFGTSEELKEVINLIYDNLPAHLKTCLVYLNMYPEDSMIRKDDLVKQWVAEGFLDTEIRHNTEKLAGTYFDELVTRGMIQPVETNYDNEVLSCTVHHMVLDLIAFKSMEENFITVVDYFDTVKGHSDKVRRLSLQFGGAKGAQIPENFRISQVRSLLFSGFFSCVPSIEKYRFLRVLILDVWADQDKTSIDLATICDLFRLRYLKITGNVAVTLPGKMDELTNLETLEVHARVNSVPSDIVYLQRLLHLRLPGGTDLPPGIGGMTSLLTLGYFDLSSNSEDIVRSLCQLTNLHDLYLTCSRVPSNLLFGNMKVLGSVLGSLGNLKSVTLVPGSAHGSIEAGTSNMSISCEGFNSMSSPPALLERLELFPRICIFSRLPWWIGMLDKLRILKIGARELWQSDIDIIKRLSFLFALSLYVRAAPAERIVFQEQGFQALKYFKFICSALCIAFEEKAMPNVQRIKLGFNANRLEQWGPADAGLENLKSLKVFAAKVGGAGADESGRKAVQSALEAFSKHGSRPVINVQWVDWVSDGDNEMSMVAQTEQHQTQEKTDVITVGSSYAIGERGSTEDTNRRVDSRSTLPLESTSHMHSPEIGMAYPVTGAAIGWGISVAGWLISPIISKLLNKGFSYLGSRSSDKLEELEQKVILLKLMLEAVQASPGGDRLEPWMKELKSVFYDAEDILDAIDYHSLENRISSQTEGKSAVTYSPRKLKTTQDAEIKNVLRLLGTKLEGTIRQIENLIDEGHELLSLLKLPGSSANIKDTPNNAGRSPTEGSQTTSATPPVVFGRDGDLGMIRRMLRDTPANDEPSSCRTKCYSVSGIHGIPGSGKTTLAQYVCENEREDCYFNLVMWINLSQNFSVKTVFNEMLDIASGTSRDRLSNNLDMLQSELEAELTGKRFLLVLDDVWYSKGSSEQKLDLLLSPLKAGDMGSKILVTTRNADAARALGAQNLVQVHELHKDEFLKMFMHYALDGTPITNQALLREHHLIGRKIAEKLGGSPLAARTVAGQLRRRLDINFWRMSLNRDLLNDTMGALWWSYQQLHESVRRCFTYCSMFPRRYGLVKDDLVHLWMAQGFVETTNGTEDMKDVGLEYFNVLVSCSFIQKKVKLSNDLDEMEKFTIHDLLHDLAERVAGNDCFRVEKGMVGQIPQDVRHLYIDSDGGRVITDQVFNLKTLRTLFVCHMSDDFAEELDSVHLFMSLKKLRAVRLLFSGNTVIPACIGELKHLRYLYVDLVPFDTIFSLPATFGKLHHLQVLEAGNAEFDCSSVMKMRNLVNVQSFGRRNMWEWEWEFPDVGRLTLLRTLDKFTVRKAGGYEIQQLEHLDNLQGRLIIRGLENVESKEEARKAKLANKVHLSEVELDWNTDDESSSLMLENPDARKFLKAGPSRLDQSPDPPEEILEALRPPSLIESLIFRNYSGSTYPSWLSGEEGNLENLKYLKFYSCYGSDAPPKIELLVSLCTLIVEGCSWNYLPGNMERLTSLQELTVHNCKNILSLPGLPPSLKELELSNWNGSDDPAEICEPLVNLRTLRIAICSWNSLPENMECLTSLEELSIFHCNNILSLPKLPLSIKRFALGICNSSLEESCQTVGHPNWQKIEHITDKTLF